MDDQYGKKSACWDKTRVISPSFSDILRKIEEVKLALESERAELEAQVASEAEEVEEEQDLDVGTMSDG